jgi:hypothetical protein
LNKEYAVNVRNKNTKMSSVSVVRDQPGKRRGVRSALTNGGAPIAQKILLGFRTMNSLADCAETMGSRLKYMIECLKTKTSHVPVAESTNLCSKGDCMSTMIMRRAKSEDCYALNAILVLDTSSILSIA